MKSYLKKVLFAWVVCAGLVPGSAAQEVHYYGVNSKPLEQPDGRLEQIKGVLAALPAGVSYLILHPAQDTPELRAITPDWRGRVADYQAFTSQGLRALVKDAGVHVIGWRVLRDLMRRRA